MANGRQRANAMAKQRQTMAKRVNSISKSWTQHGRRMVRTWHICMARHGNIQINHMAKSWPKARSKHGNNMATSWQRHGNTH
eukprot:10292443-Lingulodinium_polyedra.AAC.1